MRCREYLMSSVIVALVASASTALSRAAVTNDETRSSSIDAPSPSRFAGKAIPVEPSTKPFVIRHIPVADCRVLRGFCWSPVDGSDASVDCTGRCWEYNKPGAGAGVKYEQRGSDGLHILLAEGDGVNAIQIRGGARARVVADCAEYDKPDSGRLVHEFEGRAQSLLAWFPDGLASDSFSFFDVSDGEIADAGFFRVSSGRMSAGELTSSPLGPAADATPFVDAMKDRFGGQTGIVCSAFADGGGSQNMLNLKAGQALHIIADPPGKQRCVAAVGLKGRFRGITVPTIVILQVQDPVNPFCAITTVAIELGKDGEFDLVLDIPDHFIPEGAAVWLTAVPEFDVSIGSPRFDLYETTRNMAAREAFDHQFGKLRGWYSLLSEARPWNVLYSRRDIGGTWKETHSALWRYLETFMKTMDYCEELDPTHAMLGQYRTWFYRRADDKSGMTTLQAPRIDSPSGTPEWASAARAAWLEMRGVTEWWLDNRLVATGEFGSGMNADTCLYQDFADCVVFENDGVAARAREAGRSLMDLANAKHLKQGLNLIPADPLHACTAGINHESLMAWWHYGDPVYMEQCMVAARNVEALTTVNHAGHRHFTSTEVGSELPGPTKLEYDGRGHAQLMHPVMEVIGYSRNPRAMELLVEYADAWLAHMQVPGKYAQRVDTLTDKVTATGPEPFGDGMGFQCGVMFSMFEATRDRKYLQPLLDFYAAKPNVELGLGWIPDTYNTGLLDGMTNTVEYLSGLSQQLRWMHLGDRKAVVGDLRQAVSEIQTFRHMYTSAEPFTDRVFPEYGRKLNAPALAFTGGYETRNKPYHSGAVSWEGFGTNYAALVRSARRDRLEVLVYNFSDQPVGGTMRIWKLAHGRYKMETGIDDNDDDKPDKGIQITKLEVIKGNPVSLVLQPRATTVVSLLLENELDPLEDRADLALSSRETGVKGRVLSGVAHNIGARDAGAVAVAVYDSAGNRRMEKRIGDLKAPVDLTPSRITFKFDDLPAETAGWSVVLDPDDAVQEITELNNMVMLR